MSQNDYWRNEYHIAARPPRLAWPGLIAGWVYTWADQARPKISNSAWPGAWPARPPGACQAPGQAGSSDLKVARFPIVYIIL
jgi:hypothetical protein